MATFVVHRHSAGRGHFDVRLVVAGRVRSWSLLKEPPLRPGERRLAIEREEMSVDQVGQSIISEEAFGSGRARIWDSGNVTVVASAAERLVLDFDGDRVQGRYELRRMKWYPGNRWLIEKSASPYANLT